MSKEQYLGDGIYMVQGSYVGEVILKTPREEGDHWMALGPNEIALLTQTLKDWGWWDRRHENGTG